MTSRSCRFGFTLAFLGFAATLPPATAQAQPPVYVTQWGTFGNGNGQLQYPRGIATDVAGNVYVMDTSNYRLEKFTSTGAYITQWGFAGHTAGHFELPFGVAVDAAGNVYVADTYNSRIQKFIGDGIFLTQWGSGGNANGRFALPQGVAVDAAGNVYVADTGNNRVQKFTSGGAFLTKWGTLGSGNGQFVGPSGVTTDAAGDVYVSDSGNNRIQKFSSTGAYVTQWGSPGDGEGQFNFPFGMACDAAGDIYVADILNHRIQKFTNTGAYLLQWGEIGYDNGQMNAPHGVAIDPAGDIYVVDMGNSRIQKFRQSRAVSFDLDPNTLNLQSHGRWVTGYLEPESPLAAGDVDIASIRLNGAVPVDSEAPTELGDHDGDAVPDLMVKFSRSAVELIVSQGDNVPVTVSGTIGTTPIIGTDHIRVIRGVVLAPQAGSHLTQGAVAQVRWDTPGDVTVASVDLLQSLDGGGTWSLIASGQPNTGSYDWRVPSVQTIRAKVAVVADEAGAGVGGVSGVLGVSEAFSIAALVGVNDGAPARFEMLGVAPNPAQRQFRVSFSLRDSRAATLELFDVSGRRVEARQLDGMGAGRQSVMLGGQGQLPVGLYLIRLTQDGRSLTTRAAIVR